MRPGFAVRGALRAPGSKSLAQRALVSASLCGDATRIAGLPDGEDVRAALELVAAVGVEVERLAPAAVRVRGAPPGPYRGWKSTRTLEVGESGTLARFALAASALCGCAGQRFELAARGSLARRTSRPLLRALAEAGVEIERDTWPIALRALGPPSELRLREPLSSQEVSALLIALAAYPDEIRLEVDGAIPSLPYALMTVRTLERFGARIATHPRASGTSFVVRGPLCAPSEPLAIEPDASLAAVALAAACLSGGEVLATGLSRASAQGDVRIVEHLNAFGCCARYGDDGLVASGFPQRGARVDCAQTPDLAPVLAALAAGAALIDGGPSELIGLETLPGKESSRIEVLARGLREAGWSAEAGATSLRIDKGAARSVDVMLDPAGDHRMAFAFGLLGLLRDGVDVADPDCVAKSWPGFWSELATLGARVASR